MIHGIPELAIRTGRLFVTDLVLIGSDVSLVLRSLLLTCWPRFNSASSAVVAYSNVFSYVDSLLIHIANLGPVYVPYRCVIEEVPSLPPST